MSRLRHLAVPLAAELNPSISGEALEAALVTAYSVDGQQRALEAGATALPFATARAQGKFPDRPIKLIIPWAAGGPADAGFRILAESVSQKLGQPVVVENKGGAAGVLGALALQDAKPDGYTISQMHMSVLRQPMLNASLKYDPIKDLTYILQITGFVMGVVVRPDAPWKTLPELLAYAKANPGKLNWGTLGAGSTQHLAMESLGLKEGLTWTHAPYRGTADTLRALMGGEIDFASESSGWAPLVITSLTHIATRSMPTVSGMPASIATLSLVPTPSVPDTRMGSRKPAALRSNRPPKPPRAPMTQDVPANPQWT